MAADEAGGGKLSRGFSVSKVVSKEIIGESETRSEDKPPGLCENPKKVQVKYILVNGKFKEK